MVASLAGGVLKWAAHLHEIGLTISHTGFHKHGGYVVRNADMPGFSRDDQVMTAAPRTIGPNELAEGAVALMTMETPKVTCLFVVDPDGDGQAQGILHIHDCLRAGLG